MNNFSISNFLISIWVVQIGFGLLNFSEARMEEIREILQFLEPSARLDLKIVALQHILGLTGSPEGLELISQVPELVRYYMILLIYIYFLESPQVELAM